MLKFLYLDGTINKRKFGTSLRNMKVNNARPLVIEYDEVDWNRVREIYYGSKGSLLMQDYWSHNMMECVDQSISFPMPKNIKDIIYPPIPKSKINPFFDTKRGNKDYLLVFERCDICNTSVLGGSECLCKIKRGDLKAIPITYKTESKEFSEDALLEMQLQKGKVDVEDRSMECVGCQ